MEKNGVLMIGPSNGWLFAQKIYDLPAHQKFLKEAGANAVELVMNLGEEERQKTLLSGKIDAFFISVHLDDYYPDKPMHEQILPAKNIFDRHKARAAVIHPVENPEFYYEALTTAGISVHIENMDKNKPRGYHPKELWDLMEKHGMGFVLDVQHAFDRDHDMHHYAWDLFEMGRTRLRYLHVSGQSPESIHSLVHKSDTDNAKTIVDFVGKVISQIRVPIILEGQYTTPLEVRKEIEFLKQELGF
jgi:hypothetical protein